MESTSVGIWLECSAEALRNGHNEESLRWAQGLTQGLVDLPIVQSISVPCDRLTRPLIEQLLRDCDGNLSPKLTFPLNESKNAKRERIRQQWLQSIQSSRFQIESVGGTTNPYNWIQICIRRAKEPKKINRKFIRAVKTLWELFHAAITIAISQLQLHKTEIVRCALRSKVKIRAANEVDLWIIPDPTWTGVRQFPGKKVLIVPDLVLRERILPGIERQEVVRQNRLMGEAFEWADKVVCFSEHARSHIDSIMLSPSKHPLVIRPATSAKSFSRKPKDRQEMGRELRSYFQNQKPDRFYCDFPFENCEYLFASGHYSPNKNFTRLLMAYSVLLRHQRRNLKLVVAGHLQCNLMLKRQLVDHGLVFDVIECPNVDRSLHESLIANSVCYVIPTQFESNFPIGFLDAVRLGVPAALSRTHVISETIGCGIEYPEYFDPCNIDDMVRSIGYVIDNRGKVLADQKQISQNISTRAWTDVAADY
ncbi:MAG TPA: glycosyltransferase, partial [Pirellula sp.]|nr:glycosyltransferase [Pirellula sp.]